MVKTPAKNNIFNQRSSLLTVFLVLIFASVIFKLFDLQVIHGQQILAQANAQHNIYQKLLPSRGQIELVNNASDLNTIPVATNLKSYLVYAVPQEIINPNLAAP